MSWIHHVVHRPAKEARGSARGAETELVMTSHRLEIHEVHDEQDRTVLELIGDVDLRTATLLRQRIESAGQPGASLVIDLRQVGFMDSPGLGTLIYCDRVQRRRGGHLVLKNPVGPVRDLFEIALLASLIEIE